MKERKIVRDLEYEQIILGEREPDITIDKERLREIEESNQEILADYPPEFMAQQIEKRMTRKKSEHGTSRQFRKVYIPLSAAAVFILFFTIFPFNVFDSTTEGERGLADTVRLKGSGPSLYIYRGDRDNTELLLNNSLVREKDLLQIAYSSAGAKYGVIFSIDGRGTVTLHFPDNVYSNTRLDSGNKVLLPYSYELDNAPFFERFFFVTSENEIDAQAIMEKASLIAKGNKSEMLPLTEETTQQAVILFKEEVK